MIAHNPLHRSGQAELPHPAPALGDDAHALERIGVADFGRWKPVINQPIHALPSPPPPFTPSPKREVPVAANLEPKALDGRTVGGHAVVAREAANHRAQPLSLFGNRRVHPLPEFGFDLLKFPTQPLAHRLTDYRVHSVTPLLPADVREAEKVECFRPTLTAPLPVFDRIGTEFQQPRLLRVQRQTKLSESLLQFSQTPFRFRLGLESDHEVVRPPDDDHIALSLRCSPVMNPQIQDIVKEHVGQERGNHSALWGSFLDGLPSALLHHAGAQPFLNEPHDARITNPVLDELHEPSVIERIEKSTNVGIDDPVHLPGQHSGIEGIQTVMLAASGPVAIRESEKLCLVDRIKDQHRRRLHDLVLQHRYSQRPLLSIRLGNPGSTNRFCPVSPALEPFGQVPEVFLQSLSVLLPRLPIHPGRRIPLEAVIRLSQRVQRVDVVHEACELELLILQCSLTYPLQLTVHPFPALNPADVLVLRVSFGRKASLHPLRRCLLSSIVRRLRRYYPSVRLPLSVHHRRTPFGFPTRSCLHRAGKGSPGSRARCFRACLGSMTPPGPSVSCLSDTSGVAFRISLERRHSGPVLTRLDTMPALSSFNASRLTLRTAVHDQVRRGRLPLRRAELSSANNAPVYPGAQGVNDDRKCSSLQNLIDS